jgi:hypothetical protein
VIVDAFFLYVMHLTIVCLLSEISDMDVDKKFDRAAIRACQKCVHNETLEASVVGLQWIRVSEMLTTDTLFHAFTAATIIIARRTLSDTPDIHVYDLMSVPKKMISKTKLPSVEGARERHSERPQCHHLHGHVQMVTARQV